MSGVKVNNGVVNYGGLPSGGSGLLAARPAAAVVGRIYIASDSLLLYRDTGSAWVTIGGSATGSGATGQATFWTGASTISGDNTFFWDNTNKRLGLGTATPGVRLDIHGTGVIQQLNGTTTNNAFTDFQNAGSTQWRVGNQYASATNRFSIFNAAGVNEVFTILQAGNIGINNSTPGWITSAYVVGVNPSYAQYINGSTGAAQANGTLFGIDGSGNGTILVQGGFNFNLYTSSIARMTIDSAGKVGFGYTSPGITGVSVSGSIYQGSNTANSNFQMLCGQNFYTVGFSPNFSTYTAATVNISVTSNLGTGYVFKTTATITVNLPAANGLNNQLYFVVLTGTTVTVNRSGSDVFINNAGTSVTSLTLVGHTKTLLYCDGGSTWYQLF